MTILLLCLSSSLFFWRTLLWPGFTAPTSTLRTHSSSIRELTAPSGGMSVILQWRLFVFNRDWIQFTITFQPKKNEILNPLDCFTTQLIDISLIESSWLKLNENSHYAIWQFNTSESKYQKILKKKCLELKMGHAVLFREKHIPFRHYFVDYL